MKQENQIPNLSIYDKVKEVPAEAKKEILAGRIKGFTDINPMWRIKIMTQTFGVCGIGWKYEILRQWTETIGDEVRAFCNINLYVKQNGEWSDAIPGTGGSSMVTKEKNGLFFSDEAYKMALTDALSVAMKALGVGASVYYERDEASKYQQSTQPEPTQSPSISSDEAMEVLRFYVKPAIEQANSREDLKKIYEDYATLQKNPEFLNLLSTRRKQIEGK